jgi:DNA modification methylase
MIQYSNNEGDLVCDLFPCGFSIAIAVISLNRRAFGFEILPTMFSAWIRQIEGMEPGALISCYGNLRFSP